VKKLLSMTALLLCIIMLAACSNDNDNGNGKGSETEGTEDVTKLTMWIRTWDNLPYFQEAVDSFNENNADVQVEIVSFNPDQYGSAMQAAVNGGEIPDLFQPFSLMNLYQLKENDMIQPLPLDQPFMDQFEEGTWWEGITTIDGLAYGYPDSSFRDPRLIFYYNKTLMREAGLDPESPPTTWDEFYEQAKTIKENTANDVYGLVEPMKADWFIGALAQMLGTTVNHQSTYITNQDRFAFDWKNGKLFTKDGIMESAAFIKQFIDEDIMLPDYLLMDPPAAAAQFGEGKAGFSINGYWFLRTFLDEYTDLDFGVASLPSKSYEPYSGTWGGSPTPFYLSSKTENTDAVKRLLEHFTKEYYPLLVKNQQNLSPISEINNDPNLDISPQFRDYIDIVNRTVRLQPSPLISNSVEAQVMTHINSIPLKESVGKILQQYMSSNNYNLEEELSKYEKMSEEQLEESLNQVEGASRDHWTFPNWEIANDYALSKYEELK